MANNTQRISNLEGCIGEQSNSIQQLQTRLDDSISSLKRDFDERLNQKMEQMMRGFEVMLSLRLPPSSKNTGNLDAHAGSVLGTFENLNQDEKGTPTIFKSIKFEFPRFDGSNPRSWIRKCNKLFSHHSVADNHKLYLVTMNLEGEAEEWYSGFVQGGPVLTWDGFVDEIMARFSPENQLNPIGELKNLQQLGTVDEYRKRFEELKGWSLIRNPSLNEAFFMDCFLGGLKEEIRLGIQELKLQTLKDLIRMARVEEAKLEAWVKRSRMGFKVGGPGSQLRTSPMIGNKPTAVVSSGVSNIVIPSMEFEKNLPIRGFTREQLAEKRRNEIVIAFSLKYL